MPFGFCLFRSLEEDQYMNLMTPFSIPLCSSFDHGKDSWSAGPEHRRFLSALNIGVFPARRFGRQTAHHASFAGFAECDLEVTTEEKNVCAAAKRRNGRESASRHRGAAIPAWFVWRRMRVVAAV